MPKPENEQTCRFCHYPSSANNRLFHPCKCQGTIRYIHGTCLEKWLRRIKKDECELCNFKYQFNYVYDKKMTSYKLLSRLYRIMQEIILYNIRIAVVTFFPLLLVLSFGYVGCWFFGMHITMVRVFCASLLSISLCGLILQIVIHSQNAIKKKIEKETVKMSRQNHHLLSEQERIEQEKLIDDAVRRFEIKARAARKELELKLGIPEASSQPDTTSLTPEIANIDELSTSDKKGCENTTRIQDSFSTDPITSPAPVSHRPVSINTVLPPYTEPRPRGIFIPGIYGFDIESFNEYIHEVVYNDLVDAINFTTISKIICLACKSCKIAFIYHMVSILAIYIPSAIGKLITRNFYYPCKLIYYLQELNIEKICEAITIFTLGTMTYISMLVLAKSVVRKSKLRRILDEYLGTIKFILSFFTLGVTAPILTGTLISLWIFQSYNVRYLYEVNNNARFLKDFWQRCIDPFMPCKTNMFAGLKTISGKDYHKGHLVYLEKFSNNYLACSLRILNKHKIDTIALIYFLGILSIFICIFFKNVIKKTFRDGFLTSQESTKDKESDILDGICTISSLLCITGISLVLFTHIFTNYLAFIMFEHFTSKFSIIFTFNSPTKLLVLVFVLYMLQNRYQGLERYFICINKALNFLCGLFTQMNNTLFGIKSKNTDRNYIKWKPNKNITYTEKQIKKSRKKGFTDKQLKKYYNTSNAKKDFMLFHIPKHYEALVAVHSCITLLALYIGTYVLFEIMFKTADVYRQLYYIFLNYFTLIGQDEQSVYIFTNNLQKYKHLEIFVIFSLIPINWIFELIYNIQKCYWDKKMSALNYHINHSLTILIHFILVFFVWPTLFFLSIKITMQDIYDFLPVSKPTVCRNAFIICVALSHTLAYIMKKLEILPASINVNTFDHHRKVILAFTKRIIFSLLLPYASFEVLRKYLNDTTIKLVYITLLGAPYFMIIRRSVYKYIVSFASDCFSDVYKLIFLVERHIINQDE